jgi:TolA-binding protein
MRYVRWKLNGALVLAGAFGLSGNAGAQVTIEVPHVEVPHVEMSHVDMAPGMTMHLDEMLQQVRMSMDGIGPAMQAAQLSLEMSRPAMEHVRMAMLDMGPELTHAAMALDQLQLTNMSFDGVSLSGEMGHSEFSGATRFATRPAAPWSAADPADSLYRAAREALNRNDYRQAASLFQQLSSRYPDSDYAGDAMYWRAFALYRLGSERELRSALDILTNMRSRYPKASTFADAGSLGTRIRGELARRGGESEAEEVTRQAEGKADADDADARGTADSKSRHGRAGDCPDEDDDMRIAALNALLQMNSERAMPILKKVLDRRDPCSEPLRRKAVFLVSQKSGDDASDVLLDAARKDPDAEVRRQAVFWLSQVNSDRAVSALDSILHNSRDTELQEKAIFALSQHSGAHAAQILRSFAESDAPEELRGKAIFWIGQYKNNPDNGRFLRDVYRRTQSAHIREEIMRAVAEQGGDDNLRWVIGVAEDTSQDIEVRKKALFWAGQQNDFPLDAMLPLYTRLRDQEMKEYFIFVLSQRSEKQATDKLIDIVKSEKNKELRKKAIFWLGQRDDPRVKQALLDIIDQ